MSQGCCSEEFSDNVSKSMYRRYVKVIISFVLFLVGVILEFFEPGSIARELYWLLYGSAYLLVGKSVVWNAMKKTFTKDIFNENFLMSIATIGAFLIGEYTEAVAVMLFYEVGELFQSSAVNKATRSINSLLKLQIEEVTVIDGRGKLHVKHPEEVSIGETIQVRAGEKVALDGELITEHASFNTTALTGESVPEDKIRGESVLAGMINLNTLSKIKVTSRHENTKLSKILKLVQQAVTRKAPTQKFITRFAKIYTPIVVLFAISLAVLPFFIVEEYVFREWLYRALVFLVVSCPCALVISIPLGYFGGIGAASRNGILFKGANYLDLMTKIDTVVMDKTGTLTKGVFEVQEVLPLDLDENIFLEMLGGLERHSTHPIAQAIVKYIGEDLCQKIIVRDVEEMPGHGLRGVINHKVVLAGNGRLMDKCNVVYDKTLSELASTTVFMAIDGIFVGHITIADSIKDDALKAIEMLKETRVSEVIMLSGDKKAVVKKVAKALGLKKSYGELLPEDKVNHLLNLQESGRRVLFVGDGINDAPVIAIADIGVAMGGLGSDVAIEAADVVIQTDHPSKIASSIKIGEATNKIVWQNIGLAFVVKLVVLILGAGGLATMWEAVFADVGVTLLAILNAARIQKIDFSS